MKATLSGLAYEIYTKDLANLPTYEENSILTKKFSEEGNISIRNQILEKNQSLIISIAKKYVGNSYELTDLIQEANIAFINALSTYDPKQGALSTYISKRIHWHLNNLILSTKFLKPANFSVKARKFNRIIEDHQKLFNSVPTDKKLMEMLKVHKTKLQELKNQSLFRVTSYNKNIESEKDGEKNEIIDVLPSLTTGLESIEKKDNQKRDYLLKIVLKSVLKAQEYFLLYHQGLSSKPLKTNELKEICHVENQRINYLYNLAKKTAKDYVLMDESSKFQKQLKMLMNRFGDHFMLLNPNPLDINDMVKYLYLEPILSDDEQIIYYEKYVVRNNFDNMEYAKMFHLTQEEFANILRNIDEKITIIFEQEDFLKWKEYYQNNNKMKMFQRMEELQEISEIYQLFLDIYPHSNLFEVISAIKLTLEKEAIPSKIKLKPSKEKYLNRLLQEKEKTKTTNEIPKRHKVK